MSKEYILDENGPPPAEELEGHRILQCKGCGQMVKVTRPHGEPMYENGRGQSWPTFYGEPEAPESCKKCSPPSLDTLRAERAARKAKKAAEQAAENETVH